MDNIFVFITLGILAFIIYKIWSQSRRSDSNPSSGGGGGGGSGGGNGGGGGSGGGGWFRQTPRNDPPPPYSAKLSSSQRAQPTSGSSPSRGYTPGFFEGVGLAGLGGFLAGRYTAPQASTSSGGLGRERARSLERERTRERERQRARERETLRNRDGNRDRDVDDEWENVPRSSTRGFFGSSRFGGESSSGPSSDLGAMRTSTGYGVTSSR